MDTYYHKEIQTIQILLEDGSTLEINCNPNDENPHAIYVYRDSRISGVTRIEMGLTKRVESVTITDSNKIDFKHQKD